VLTNGYSVSGSGIELGTSDVFRNYVYSALATKIEFDKSQDLETLEITYHDDEVSGNVFVTSAAVSSVGETGNMVFTDAEKTSWEGYDVILVGGSCINTATATALDLASGTCGDAWVAATTISEGKYLIKSVADKFTTGKTALVVAGYSKENTVAASTYLRTNGDALDTSAGNAYMGIVGSDLSSTVSAM